MKNNAEEVAHGEGLLVNNKQGRKGYEARKNRKNKKVQCNKCKKWGHIKRDCPDIKSGSNANMATCDDDCEVLLVSDSRSNKDEVWMLHSASYFHATPNKE
jgi:hypothetical protein